jgi:hypothetical protein
MQLEWGGTFGVKVQHGKQRQKKQQLVQKVSSPSCGMSRLGPADCSEYEPEIRDSGEKFEYLYDSGSTFRPSPVPAAPPCSSLSCD